MVLKFLIFGSHNIHIESGQRLLEQAKSLELFDNLDFYTGYD